MLGIAKKGAEAVPSPPLTHSTGVTVFGCPLISIIIIIIMIIIMIIMIINMFIIVIFIMISINPIITSIIIFISIINIIIIFFAQKTNFCKRSKDLQKL